MPLPNPWRPDRSSLYFGYRRKCRASARPAYAVHLAPYPARENPTSAGRSVPPGVPRRGFGELIKSQVIASALAWILLSHFGELATVTDCHDPELLAKIRDVLEDFGLRYIPYDYAASRTYNGKSAALVGFSWANRYFSLVVDFNDQIALSDSELPL